MTERRGYEVLASNLHRLMFERNLTIEAVALTAGITVERLQSILSGEFDPDLDLVERIALAVGATLPDLLTEPDYN